MAESLSESPAALSDEARIRGQSHKARTRARILDEAAQALRERGTEGISVAALMKRAGLTHGGFYAHFESRDDLVAHAVERMFADSRAMLDRHLASDAPPEARLSALIDYYLSETRLTQVAGGCPMPPLLGEAARMPPAAQAVFARGIAGFRERLRAVIAALGRAAPEELAASAMAEMIGALTIARALGTGEEASAHLRASRQRLKERLGLAG